MASAERSEVPRELEETLRHRARDFIRDARARGRAWTEKELLDAFLEIWSPFSAAEADVALSLLLQSFLAEARENGTFVATIEGWTERLATDKRPCAGIILDAFYAEANASYAIALEERGAVWFDDYFPVIPKGDAFAMSSLPLFRECLFRYCEALAREGINDHLSYCWSNLSARFRRSPYLNEFCRHFELLTSSQLIGHYKLEQLVGIGGMGVVYRATHKDLHRVALKMMRPDCTCPDRFSQEVLRTVELDDPRRFVVIKDSDLRHTPPFFTMDFVESGKSLLDLLQNLRRGDPLVRALQKTMKLEGSISSKERSIPRPLRRFIRRIRKGKSASDSPPLLGDRFAAALLAEVAEAAHDLHTCEGRGLGYLHCDLKPSNILLSKKNGPLLSDLGLSRRLNRSGFTEREGFSGTREYCSPEQAAGEALTVRSDVYQLGVTLYQTLTGRLPIAAQTCSEAKAKIVQCERRQPLVSTRTFRRAIPRSLDAICRRALQQESENRYSSAKEFAEDLRRFLLGRPVRARGGYPVRVCLHHCSHTKSFWVILTLILIGWYVFSQNSNAIPGVLASKNKYRIQQILPASDPVLVPDSQWPSPSYPHVTFRRSSVLMDLSHWRRVEGHDPFLARKTEPAYYTRVVTLLKNPESFREGKHPPVIFQFRTGGKDVDLYCPTHPTVWLHGSPGQVEFGNRKVVVREIAVDVSEDRSPEVTVVIQGIIWNGFQPDTEGQQWAAYLTPDGLSDGELAIIFPKGRRPTARPRFYERPYVPGSKSIEIEAKDVGVFEPQPGVNWWVWTFFHPKGNHQYTIQFPWTK